MENHILFPVRACTGCRRAIFQAGYAPDSAPKSRARTGCRRAKVRSRSGMLRVPGSECCHQTVIHRPQLKGRLSSPTHQCQQHVFGDELSDQARDDPPNALRTPISAARSSMRLMLMLTRCSTGNIRISRYDAGGDQYLPPGRCRRWPTAIQNRLPLCAYSLIFSSSHPFLELREQRRGLYRSIKSSHHPMGGRSTTCSSTA